MLKSLFAMLWEPDTYRNKVAASFVYNGAAVVHRGTTL